MSFPRYEKYKDSGVEWLGEVPEHWRTAPVKAVSTCNDELLSEATPGDFEMEGEGSIQEKQKALLAEIIAKVNDLFDGDLTENDRLVYVNHSIKGKLLESKILVQQAASNSKEQFANSPDLTSEIMNAIIDAFAAHTTMSKQALESEQVRNGLRDILLGPAQLYEALRERSATETA